MNIVLYWWLIISMFCYHYKYSSYIAIVLLRNNIFLKMNKLRCSNISPNFPDYFQMYFFIITWFSLNWKIEFLNFSFFFIQEFFKTYILRCFVAISHNLELHTFQRNLLKQFEFIGNLHVFHALISIPPPDSK